MNPFPPIIALLLLGATVDAAAARSARPAPVPAAVLPAEPVTIEAIDAALAADRTELARGLLDRAQQAGQTGPAFQLRMADVWLASGAFAPAAAAYAKLIDTPEVAARAWQGTGLVALAQGVPAAAALTRAVAADPTLSRAWAALAVTADQRGDWAAAEAAYGHALQLSPTVAATWSNRGYSRILQARYAEAVADLDAALRLAPALAAAQTNRRLALALAGDYAAAFAGSDRRQIARDLNIVGYGAMLRGDYAAADGYFTRAVETNPSSTARHGAISPI